MAKSKKPPRLWLARDGDRDKNYRLLAGPSTKIYKGGWGAWKVQEPAFEISYAYDFNFERACPSLEPGEICELEPLQFKAEVKRC